MKKTYFVFLLFTAFLFSSCGNKTTITQPDKNENILPTDMAIECSALCEDNIQNLCKKELQTAVAEGINLENSLLNESYCQLACETEWDENIIDCVSKADNCAQFINSSPYCLETEIDDEDVLLNNPQPGNCDIACRNYVKCAAYGDNLTQKDLDNAYKSCNEICGAWTDESITCIANTPINKGSDCAAQSACLLPELKNIMH